MKRKSDPSDQTGVILVHVLSVVALCSAVMTALLSVQDSAIDQTTRQVNRARAQAIALGAETSAVIALRRDMTTAPGADHAGEAWGRLNEAGVAVARGRVVMNLSDDQGRFNINTLTTDGLVAQDTLARLLQFAGDRDPTTRARAIADLVRREDGLTSLTGVAETGIASDVLARLEAVAVVLPERTSVNLNAAPEPVLAAMLANPAAARLLVSHRERSGSLAPSDFVAAGVLPPAQSGFQSRFFTADIEIEVDGVAFRLESRLVRRTLDGRPEVQVWRRTRKAAAGSLQPPS